MEVLEKGKTISIKSNRKFSTKDLLVDAGFVLILVWGVYGDFVVARNSPGHRHLDTTIAAISRNPF
jgi:hypothetical protein